jgi:hypothetical protein
MELADEIQIVSSGCVCTPRQLAVKMLVTGYTATGTGLECGIHARVLLE